jgi:predicted Zn-dependent protease with MMP-like domain
MDEDLRRLETIAEAEIAETLEALPEELRERARALPVTFQDCPNPEQCADGIQPDTLGLFIGPEFALEGTGSIPLPPQIILFLRNLWEFSDADEEIFLQEVHTTYLHELGHYLGLDEDDLFERGLE